MIEWIYKVVLLYDIENVDDCIILLRLLMVKCLNIFLFGESNIFLLL